MRNDTEKMKENIQAIQKGLFAMSKERKIALSVHSTFELIESMQQQATELQQAIDAMS